MIKINIDSKGVYSQNTSGYSVNIQNLPSTLQSATSSTNILNVDTSGLVSSRSLATTPKYEFYQNSGSNTSQNITSSGFTQLQIQGNANTILRGLSSWNTSSNIWFPKENNAIYTLNFGAEIPPVGGNPTIQINFCLSGTNPDNPTVAQRMHLRSFDYAVRNTTTPHGHFTFNFSVFADNDLFASGGMFLAETTAGSVTVQSASLLIKEG